MASTEIRYPKMGEDIFHRTQRQNYNSRNPETRELVQNLVLRKSELNLSQSKLVISIETD